MYSKPKILLLDIETAPISAHVWQLYDQNVGLNQIIEDWSVLCWCAKWHGQKKLHYEDVRNQRNKRDDSKILKQIWQLMDEADIIVGQNSISFDIKKLNARFIINKMLPPSSYRQLDTRRMAKKIFGFTSNNMEYLSNKLNTKFKKLKHNKYAGHELWSECLKGNKKAWAEMEKYNKHDVLALEELYDQFIIWDDSINFQVYHKMHDNICVCGSKDISDDGYSYLNSGKYQRYRCKKCGKRWQSKNNLLSLKKRNRMLK